MCGNSAAHKTIQEVRGGAVDGTGEKVRGGDVHGARDKCVTGPCTKQDDGVGTQRGYARNKCESARRDRAIIGGGGGSRRGCTHIEG